MSRGPHRKEQPDNLDTHIAELWELYAKQTLKKGMHEELSSEWDSESEVDWEVGEDKESGKVESILIDCN